LVHQLLQSLLFNIAINMKNDVVNDT